MAGRDVGDDDRDHPPRRLALDTYDAATPVTISGEVDLTTLLRGSTNNARLVNRALTPMGIVVALSLMGPSSRIDGERWRR